MLKTKKRTFVISKLWESLRGFPFLLKTSAKKSEKNKASIIEELISKGTKL